MEMMRTLFKRELKRLTRYDDRTKRSGFIYVLLGYDYLCMILIRLDNMRLNLLYFEKINNRSGLVLSGLV